jgi:DtxR family Mn-dependent transcriptional regulator
MEDYLEAIAILDKRNGVARVKDIGHLMGVKTSSVTEALNFLSKNGFIQHEPYGYVDLTPEGAKLAKEVKRRHEMLIKFLTKILSIDSSVADKDACKMEHSISPKTFQRLTKFIEFVETCPQVDGPNWLRNFDYYFKTGRRRKCKIRYKKESLK